ncbi:Macrolide export protein MacA [subsurface metagenome]
MKSWRVITFLLLCLALAGSMACNPFGAANQEEISRQLVKVVRGDLNISVSGAGNIDVSKEENLTFESSSGRVDKIYVSVGAKVSKGEVLAELAPLDTDALELALTQAQIALETAKYNLDEAEYNVDEAEDNLHQVETEYYIRHRVSYDRVKMAEEKVRLAEDRVRIAEMKLEAAELELAQAEKKLANETITAPFDGVVVSVDADEGDTVSATTTIVRLIDLTSLELPVQVDEIDIPKIKLNQKAIVSIDALPTVQLEGSVTAISPVPAATGGVVLYDITIGLTVPEGSDLRVGMSATANITIEKRSSVLLVPTRAITQDNQGNTMVKVMVSGQIEKRLVVTGISTGLLTEIVDGLSEGEIVVVEMPAGMEPSDEPAGPPGLFPGHPSETPRPPRQP